MSTSIYQTTPGDSLKESIKASKPTPSYMDEYPYAKEAVEAIQAYREHEFSRLTDATVTDAVFTFLQQGKWEDTIWSYRFDARLLLEALGQYEVSDAVRKHITDIKSITEMLGRIIEFCETLNRHIYSTELLQHDIESFPDSFSEQSRKNYAEEYRERLQQSKERKHPYHY